MNSTRPTETHMHIINLKFLWSRSHKFFLVSVIFQMCMFFPCDSCSCMEQSSNQCHYSNFPGFLQKTTKNISFHKVVPGTTLVCVPCPRSTFAHATLICTFLTNYIGGLWAFWSSDTYKLALWWSKPKHTLISGLSQMLIHYREWQALAFTPLFC